MQYTVAVRITGKAPRHWTLSPKRRADLVAIPRMQIVVATMTMFGRRNMKMDENGRNFLNKGAEYLY